MFNYNCVMCDNKDNEWCYSGICSKCSELKKIIDLYGIEQVNKTLSSIYVRDIEPIEKRTHAIVTRSKAKKEIPKADKTNT